MPQYFNKKNDQIGNNSSERIGDVFTPLKWGRFVIERYSLLTQWLEGKTVCDPTMGTGQLLEALVVAGLEAGYKIGDLPLENIYGCELNKGYRDGAVKLFKEKFGVDMSKNFIRADFLLSANLFPFPKIKNKFDILLGNPPWINFVDLPAHYKETIKPLFLEYDLAENSGKLLLGGSRIELAALIVQKAVAENLVFGGKAFFFLPLSLFLNDGVHGRFRRFRKGDKVFSLNELVDFNTEKIFTHVATRYGLAAFTLGEETLYPIPCERKEKGEWLHFVAAPLGCSPFAQKDKKGDRALFSEVPPFSIISPRSRLLAGLPAIPVEKRSFPRQGINTCGANDLFFFNSYKENGEGCCIVSNKTNQAILPAKFVYPLITKDCFRGEGLNSGPNSLDPFSTHPSLPQKYLLLPYNTDGKPLSFEEIDKEPLLVQYLTKYQDRLTSRKGVMINAHIKRGVWWALLGVGSYSFAPIKIVWEAYGRKVFRPKIFTSLVIGSEFSKGHPEQLWQPNQALQAFIPCWDEPEARRLLKELSKPEVEEYLLSLKMPGTMNWAQPGKIKRLLKEKN